ncbi:MAG: Dyp-type peroxidase, partial [Chloroflexota bacterium]|nr:Dyp-type peroxidase [Chloroflexota bacterium]
MITGQSGIFALGTASHVYLEFDLRPGVAAPDLVRTLASIREPRTTVGGVNLVSGFRPELWRTVASGDIPADVSGFNHPVIGPAGFTMPATQHDAVLWLAGSEYDVLFDEARQAIQALAQVATLADELSGWPYQRFRDLTGFIDGTENPSLLEAPDVVLVPCRVAIAWITRNHDIRSVQLVLPEIRGHGVDQVRLRVEHGVLTREFVLVALLIGGLAVID